MSEQALIETNIVDDDILVIILHGSLDASTTDEFERATKKHLDEGRSKMIVDCRHMGFISSLGIGSLIALQTRLRRQGGEVKLAAIQGMANQVIRMVKLDKVLSIYGDLEYARESFSK